MPRSLRCLKRSTRMGNSFHPALSTTRAAACHTPKKPVHRPRAKVVCTRFVPGDIEQKGRLERRPHWSPTLETVRNVTDTFFLLAISASQAVTGPPLILWG